MKHLLIFFVFSISILNNVKASTIDTLLINEYQSGFDYILRVIESENLQDSIADNSFNAIFSENIWAISIKKESSFVLYYGRRFGNSKMQRKEIINEVDTFARLYELDHLKIVQPIRHVNKSPIYWYFVLVDSAHEKKFEWNSCSTSEDKCIEIWNKYLEDYFVYVMCLEYEISTH